MNKYHVAMKHAAMESMAKTLKVQGWGSLRRCRNIAKKIVQGLKVSRNTLYEKN